MCDNPEVTAKLSNKEIFTVLDFKDGFYHVELEEESTDTLSRAYLKDEVVDDKELAEVIHCITVKSFINITDEKKKEFIEKTKTDEILSQVLLVGPKSSNPLSHVYVAIEPGPSVSSENMTFECAGAPGNLQLAFWAETQKETTLNVGNTTLNKYICQIIKKFVFICFPRMPIIAKNIDCI
ncbi:hypothetical protein QE152_g6845 [Popillia japonica]|uniref:Uncharacterized protein n=1 Tax=Popillia japonica TaxID=7064 RepID=A0AAW1MGP2_POPJA